MDTHKHGLERNSLMAVEGNGGSEGSCGMQTPVAADVRRLICNLGVRLNRQAVVAQAFLPAGSRHFPVPGQATGKSPEPAHWKVCATAQGTPLFHGFRVRSPWRPRMFGCGLGAPCPPVVKSPQPLFL